MKLSDLIDIQRLQVILDHLFASNGVPIAIFNPDGSKVVSTPWRDVCSKFHRVNGITCQRCIESDRELNRIIKETGKYAISKCRNGLIDIGAPIIIDGEQIAVIFQGQFFFEKPDLEYFKKQAYLANFDEKAYIKAIKETAVVSKEEMKEMISFLVQLSGFIADMGLANLKMRESNVELHEQNQELSAVYEELVATEDELRNHYDMLVERNQELKEATEKYRLVAQGASSVIWDLNIETMMLDTSKSFENITNIEYIKEQPMKSLIDLIHPEDIDKAIYIFEDALEHDEIYEDQFRIVDGNNNLKWIHAKGKILRENNQAIRIGGSLDDVTEHINHQNYIKHMAYIDGLTGINNRNQMLNDLEDAFDYLKSHHDSKLSVILLNVDNYKDINDLYGHHLGDKLLTSIASRLNKISDERLKLYRYGGDEFIFIMKEDHPEVIQKTSERILRLFNDPFELLGKNYNLTASVGISIFPEGGTDPDRLLLNGVTALKDAKSKGKNHITKFTSSMQEKLTKLRQFDHALNLALKNNEFFLVYQPKVDVASNKVKAVEALIRWRSPKEGIIPPNDFIPIAEERGLIAKIDLWVLEESIRQVIEWTLNGYQFDYISVNMSPEFLMDQELLKHVRTLIAKYTFNPNKIQIEITENVFINSFDAAVTVLMQLKELGFSIALDDFGKGYSSLSYLKQLPIDVLKIDKLFIDGMVEDDQPIIEFIVGMGHRLKMKIVAEGVETDDQLDLLKIYDCDLYQGYLYSTPLSPIELKLHLDKNYKETLA
ncbi:EAL domain-containing protein [Acidaminobacter sp. JC074]|uniref:EAL domain-containing protein n=1 Tax=Acidaminobacter sp. JC074 TaxID=2530199 RepID=UPI001F0D9A16|nr:EAL domain-containing protein [Acidaminobacter sp. JC074]